MCTCATLQEEYLYVKRNEFQVNRELEVDATPIAVQGVESGTEVAVNFTAKVHVAKQ